MATSNRDLATFFGSKAKYRTLTPQTIILALAGIAFAGDAMAVYFTLGEAQQNYGGIVLMLTAFFALLPLIVWLVMSAVVYAIARTVKASIRYGTLLRVTGWASIPMVAAGAIIAGGRYLVLSGIDGCTTAFDCDPSAYLTIPRQVQAIFAFSFSATTETLFLGAFLVGVLLTALTAALWVLATEQVSTLTRQGALVAAGIPSVVFLLAFVYVSLF